MPRKIEKPSGRVTVRFPVELHVELARIANVYGIEVNALLNMMIRERLPDYRERADMLEWDRARPIGDKFDEGMGEVLTVISPIAEDLVAAAAKVPARQRQQAIDERAESMRRNREATDDDIRTAVGVAKKMLRAPSMKKIEQLADPKLVKRRPPPSARP
jgi:hypothetical protein